MTSKLQNVRHLGLYHIFLGVFFCGAIFTWVNPSWTWTYEIYRQLYWSVRPSLFTVALGYLLIRAHSFTSGIRWALCIAITARVLVAGYVCFLYLVGNPRGLPSPWITGGIILEFVFVLHWILGTLFGAERDETTPPSDVGVAALSAVITGVLAVTCSTFSVMVLGEYGLSLFALTPLLLGAFAAYLRGYLVPATMKQCIAAAMSSVWLTAAALLFLALEGFICIAMALPLLIVMAIMGAVIGYYLQSLKWKKSYVMLSLILINPLSMIGEKSIERIPPPITIVTERQVPVEPELLWRAITERTELGLSRTPLGRVGVTVPERIELRRSSSGDVLECDTTNGSIQLEVLRLEPGRRIVFRPKNDFTPMKELTPYDHIHAPHLDGYMIIEYGSIELVRSEGGTLMKAETRLHHRIWPVSYWSLYTEAIVDVMHGEVLAALEEAANGQRRSSEGDDSGEAE